ncbi:phosphotransferase [Actinomadura sp. CNU-125]|uniref:phosphotransferase n=1 Tax=Actinomadura sp. CNU-125 TaxID=1904961 RepID=UPI0009F856B2|nr:phosphotransferase [Actinomadura sp. CNU-125]
MAVDFEVPLSGTGGVVRVADTVRRPGGAHSAAVRGLLRHLEGVGFEAPRVLGTDEAGRDVVSWVPGDVPGRPLPGYAGTDEALRGVARLVRRYHEAVASFGVPDGPWDLGGSYLDGEPEVVGHCDVTPENVVFRGGVPVALIDFDLARPTRRLYDVVTALRHWGPIADPADRDAVWYGVDVGRRLRVFCDAYGLDRRGRGEVLPAARVRFERSYEVMRARARRGGRWGSVWQGGAGPRIRRAQDWLERHWDELDACLC